MSWLWTKDALLEAMAARATDNVPDGITGLSIDTRTLSDGEAYFAIKGDVHDGHKFVASAYASGAGLSVVSEEWVDKLDGETGPLLIVDDVLVAMEKLGMAARARTDARIIAVTGSVGKTSTKEALRTALSPSGKVHAAVASFNNHWGVPLTLARMPENADYGVIEIGMNHPNEITPLVKMARPHIAIITNVAAVHLGAFKNVDEIAHAKAEIFDGLEPNGTAVLNFDDERYALLETSAQSKGVNNIVRFGEKDGSEAQIKKLVLHGSCSCLTANVLGHEMVVKIGAPGKHIAQNAMAVLAAVQLAGADLAKAGIALGDMKPVKGRGERHQLSFADGAIVLIDESYNANPTSMKAALALLASTHPKDRGRRVAVMGDMLELGPTSKELHGEISDAVIANKVDRVFLAGAEMKALDDALSGRIECTHAADIETLIPMVRADLTSGDVVMVKSSLGSRSGKLVDDLLAAFPPKTNDA